MTYSENACPNYNIEDLIGLPLEEKERVSLEMIDCSSKDANNQYVFFSGGKKSIVLLHLVKRLNPGRLNVLHAETSVEFIEVTNYINKIKRLWGLNLINAKADNSYMNIGRKHPKCCSHMILEPLRKVAAYLKIDCAYIGTTYDNVGNDWSILKNNKIQVVEPITHFIDEDVWNYIKKYNLPHCSLYREGYKNLDCEPCSRLNDAKTITVDKKDEAHIKESLRRLGYL